MKRNAPYQINRKPNPHEANRFDFELREVITGRLVCAEWRCKSPVPPKLLLEHQARLNTAALLDGPWPLI